MDVLNPEKLIFFLYFFIPGFIALKFYRLLFAGERIDFSKSVYEAIGISCINLVICIYPLLKLDYFNIALSNPWKFYLITILFISIIPIVLTILLYWIIKRSYVRKWIVSPEKIPWDWHFSQGDSYWVIVTLKDGKKIGGKFDKKSKASTSPKPKEIYIEELWNLDKEDNFLNPIKRSKGIIILENNIVTIEFKSA